MTKYAHFSGLSASLTRINRPGSSDAGGAPRRAKTKKCVCLKPCKARKYIMRTWINLGGGSSRPKRSLSTSTEAKSREEVTRTVLGTSHRVRSSSETETEGAPEGRDKQ